MTVDVSDLATIFRMITPSDILGAQKLTLGTKVDNEIVVQLLKVLYGSGAGGVLTIDDLAEKLSELSTSGSEDSKALFKRLIRFYSSTGKKVDGLSDSQYIAVDRNGTDTNNSVTFEEIIGKQTNKKMGIIVSNSGYLSPLVRNADKVELFMNSIPSIIASRMVPYLEVEFVFNRPDLGALQSPGLLKFLLGSDNSQYKSAKDNVNSNNGRTVDTSTATGKMIAARTIANLENDTEISTSGMEMFTSPQTLINPTPLTPGSRYVDVLDPFRPFMSIESFTVNVTPTVGLMSYRKATLILKLHDRSRLAEISDIVRPQIYQNSRTAPTVWINYGWRHPYEPGNPYSDFINGNMLIREAYGIVNAQFAFDQTGQVTITMELWTKGLTELRTLRITDSHDDALPVLKKIESLAGQIAAYKRALNIGPAEGINREIRGYTILESAERGTFPDMATKDILDAVNGLEKSLSAPGSKMNKPAADALKKALSEFYSSSDKKNLNYKQQIKTEATVATAKKFNEVMMGPDPFIPTSDKDKKLSEETKKPNLSHPLGKIYASKNKELSTNISDTLADSTAQFKGYKKKVVSFGKLFSVFTCQAAMMIDGVDEVQIFFYQFNDQAGLAASTNIAEFPIDMPVLLDQYRDHVERKGSERLSIEEFLKLIIDAQISDTRSLGYGFRSFFAPYDPSNVADAKLKDGQEQAYENALAGISAERGPFNQPSLELYVETTYVSKEGSTTDLLRQFEQKQSDPGGASTDYTRVMRMHIFDRTNNPYKLPGTLLKGDSESGAAFIEIDNDYVKNHTNDTVKQTDVLRGITNGTVTSDAKVELKKGFSNEDIKRYVSKMVPTIVYGSNATMITSANLASKQDPLLSVVQTQGVAQRAGKATAAQPNGSGVGGLPLRIIPASMTMNSMGCPLLNYGQLFFVDFNTGTTVDNIYGLTGITHTLTPGKFDSQMTLTYYDAYGKYEGAPTINDYISHFELPEPKK